MRKDLEVGEPYTQPIWELIACVYDVKTHKWTCFSASDISRMSEHKYEILEVEGKKRMVGNDECICFNPEQGEITWVMNNKMNILKALFDDIKSVIKTGRSEWHNDIENITSIRDV